MPRPLFPPLPQPNNTYTNVNAQECRSARHMPLSPARLLFAANTDCSNTPSNVAVRECSRKNNKSDLNYETFKLLMMRPLSPRQDGRPRIWWCQPCAPRGAWPEPSAPPCTVQDSHRCSLLVIRNPGSLDQSVSAMHGFTLVPSLLQHVCLGTSDPHLFSVMPATPPCLQSCARCGA